MAIRKLRMLGALGGHRERPLPDFPAPPGVVVHQVKDADDKVVRSYWTQPFEQGDVLDFDTSRADESDAVCDKLVKYKHAEDVTPKVVPSPVKPSPAPSA